MSQCRSGLKERTMHPGAAFATSSCAGEATASQQKGGGDTSVHADKRPFKSIFAEIFATCVRSEARDWLQRSATRAKGTLSAQTRRLWKSRLQNPPGGLLPSLFNAFIVIDYNYYYYNPKGHYRQVFRPGYIGRIRIARRNGY
jgi:hypothetical protein